MTDTVAPTASRRAHSYLASDPRSLALGRVALALVLLLDLAHRALGGVALWYSNAGLVPNHTVLWRPPTQWIFSLFFMASRPDEAALGFALCALVYLALLVGWRTRLVQALSVVAVLSLHGRTAFLLDGGDWTLGALTVVTAFLPLGRRFSADAVRASLRRRPESTAAELDARAPRDVTPVVSLAVLAVMLQLASAALFAALDVHGAGQTSSVHDVFFHANRMTWLGAWLRPHVSPALSRGLAWGTIAIEIGVAALILAPVQRPRRLAILAFVGLHASVALLFHVGIFPFAMMAFTPFLLVPADWERLSRRRARGLVVYFDAGCGVCFQIARVLARLDPLERLTFRSSDDEIARPEGVTTELMARTIVVIDEATGAVTTRADGLARILGALPGGFLWALPSRLPGVRQLANVAYDAFAARRQWVSMWLGLAACGVPNAAPKLRPPVDPAPSPVRAWLGRAASIVRELVVAALIAILVGDAVAQARQDLASAAPNVTYAVIVDAVTKDGRHVDPYGQVPRDSFSFNYASRIPFAADYFAAFQEWILRYPARTGRPQDALVRYDAWMVEDGGPAPDRDRPSHVFLSWAKK